MRTLLLAVLVLLPAAGPRAADTNDAAARVTIACRRELRSMCRGKVKPGESPLGCLKEKKERVGAACREALDALGDAPLPAAGPAGRGAAGCSAEFHKACGKERGEGMKACLKAHRAEFSELCARIADGASKAK